MFKLLFIAAVASAAVPKLTFDDDSSVCIIEKSGKTLKSGCEFVDPYRTISKANDAQHKTRLDQAETRLDALEKAKSATKADLDAVASAFCPMKITGNHVFSLSGKRTHADGFCKFNCKSGSHDSDKDNKCVDCTKVSCSNGYYRHSDKCSTDEHHAGICSKTANYCPSSASIEQGSVSVSGRKVGDKAKVTCNAGTKTSGVMEFTCQASSSSSGKWVNTGNADCNVPSLKYIGWTTWSQCQQAYSTQNSRMNQACANSWSGSRAMTFNEHLLNPEAMPSRNPTGRWLTFTTQGEEGKGGWSGGSGNWWRTCHTRGNHCLNCYNPGSPNMHTGDHNKKGLCHTSGRGPEHPSYPGKCTDIGGCWCNTRGVMCVSNGRRRLIEADVERFEEDKADYGPVNLSE